MVKNVGYFYEYRKNSLMFIHSLITNMSSEHLLCASHGVAAGSNGDERQSSKRGRPCGVSGMTALPGGRRGSIPEGFLTEATQELKPEEQEMVGQEGRVEPRRPRGASGQDTACEKERKKSVREVTRTQYDGRRDEGREEGRFALMRSKNVGVLRVGTKIYSRRCWGR